MSLTQLQARTRKQLDAGNGVRRREKPPGTAAWSPRLIGVRVGIWIVDCIKFSRPIALSEAGYPTLHIPGPRAGAPAERDAAYPRIAQQPSQSADCTECFILSAWFQAPHAPPTGIAGRKNTTMDTPKIAHILVGR